MMRCQCRTPIRGTSRYCIPTAQTAPQADSHLHSPRFFLPSQQTAREKSRDSEKPSRSSHSPTREEERASVKGPPLTKRNVRARTRASRRSDAKWERKKLESEQVN